MSYDFEIWCQKEVNVNELSLDTGWKALENGIQYETKNWLISIDMNMKCEDEDIPDEIMPLVPSLKYLNTVCVEPIGAPKVAISIARKMAKLIGENTIGIVNDKQTDKITLPKGYRRYQPEKTQKEERITRLQLIWYMKKLPFQSVDQLGDFLKYLERVLPESLPKRYGDHEPPQFKLSVTGVDHFKEYLYDTLKNREVCKVIVWYPSKPVLAINLNGGSRNNSFPHFEIEFDSRVLRDQAWSMHIKKLFRSISAMLQPFFGEARFLRNAIASRTTYWYDSLTESSPTKAGFWMGIPRNLGPATVVGAEYMNVWPSFSAFGKKESNLCFVECDHWAEDSSIEDLIGPPPEEITQHHIVKNRKLRTGYMVKYAVTECSDYWPFDIQPFLEEDPYLDFIDEE